MSKLARQESHNLEQEERSLRYECYLAFQKNSPNRYKLLDKLKRHGVEEGLTDKAMLLSEKAKRIFRALLSTIFRQGRAVVNHSYLTSITNCTAKQNKRLIDQLIGLLQYKKIKVWKGSKISFSFVFTLSDSLQEEIRDAEQEKNNSKQTKMSVTIYNNRNSNKLELRSRANSVTALRYK